MGGRLRPETLLALTWNDSELVYFVEDDYIHLPEALLELEKASRMLPFDYLTLYDHPVRYWPRSLPSADLPLRTTMACAVGRYRWRTVESTCMTFGARVRTIQQDRQTIMRFLTCGPVQQDRAMFRELQGLGRADARPRPERLLFGVAPSLATHSELPWLAPGQDWEAVANDEG